MLLLRWVFEINLGCIINDGLWNIYTGPVCGGRAMRNDSLHLGYSFDKYTNTALSLFVTVGLLPALLRISICFLRRMFSN